MEDIKKYWWEKASDVDREYASFAMRCDDGNVAELEFSNPDVLEIYFYKGMSGKAFDWEELKEFLEKGVEMAKRDK